MIPVSSLKLMKQIQLDNHPLNRMEHLKSNFRYCGDLVKIKTPFYFINEKNITIKDHVIIQENCLFFCTSTIEIGNNCYLSKNVDINYPYIDPEKTFEELPSEPLKIGNNVFLGSNATIINGASLGNNVIVRPNSIVYTSLPDNVMVEGNPAKIIAKLP